MLSHSLKQWWSTWWEGRANPMGAQVHAMYWVMEGLQPGSTPSQPSFNVRGPYWRSLCAWGLLKVSKLSSFVYASIPASFGLVLICCSYRLFCPAVIATFSIILQCYSFFTSNFTTCLLDCSTSPAQVQEQTSHPEEHGHSKMTQSFQTDLYDHHSSVPLFTFEPQQDAYFFLWTQCLSVQTECRLWAFSLTLLEGNSAVCS